VVPTDPASTLRRWTSDWMLQADASLGMPPPTPRRWKQWLNAMGRTTAPAFSRGSTGTGPVETSFSRPPGLRPVVLPPTRGRWRARRRRY